MLKGVEKTLYPIFSCLVRFCALLVQLWTLLAQNWASGRWNVDFERPGGNLRFVERPDTKRVRPKCPLNAILVLFGYINRVKFSKSPQNFVNRLLRRRLGRFTPENSKAQQSKPPRPKSLQLNLSPQGVETPLYLVLCFETNRFSSWLLIFSIKLLFFKIFEWC